MKAKLLNIILLPIILFIMNSCSSDSSDATPSSAEVASAEKVENYNYSAEELKAMELINVYRKSVGLNTLEKINHISFKSEEHDNYMITNNVVNHNDFMARCQNIIEVLGANKVGENIAFNYNTPEGALEAWLNSPSHKENIVGNYTHFGIAIKKDPATGKKYYTNIFAKI